MIFVGQNAPKVLGTSICHVFSKSLHFRQILHGATSSLSKRGGEVKMKFLVEKKNGWYFRTTTLVGNGCISNTIVSISI